MTIQFLVGQLKLAVERLDEAMKAKGDEIHPDAVGPISTHLHEISCFVNALATGLTEPNRLGTWIQNNPPPMRGPDISGV